MYEQVSGSNCNCILSRSTYIYSVLTDLSGLPISDFMGGTCYLSFLFCPAREACAYNPCQNGGECFPDERDLTDTMYTCDCTAGWSGVHCEGRYQPEVLKLEDFVVQMSINTPRIRLWCGFRVW